MNTNVITALVRRNIKLFLKDKMTLFFTFLGPFIILLLNLLFIRKVEVDSLRQAVAGLPVTDALLGNLADSYCIAGILAVSALTVALNSSMTRVADENRHVADDFKAAPVKAWKVDLAYFLSSFVLTVALCALVLVIGLVYLAAQGMAIDAGVVLRGVGLLLLSCLSSTAFMTFLFRFFKTTQACGAFSGIVSALSGFAVGAYVQLSAFSVGMQSVLSLLPASHSAALFRRLLLGVPLAELPAPFAASLAEEYTFDLHFLGGMAQTPVQLCWLGASVAVFFGLNLLVYRLQRKKRARG
ncbi:MAG: ABC transporter permease [Oscillospiraceae bacterium]|jgi:multidrug/hemolysin transport system permease protein|nr:ABC transporter permease [Oscillospiraceae bacterium]